MISDRPRVYVLGVLTKLEQDIDGLWYLPDGVTPLTWIVPPPYSKTGIKAGLL